MADLSQYLDFMEEVEGDGPGAGFMSPPMPSPAHPKGRQYQIDAPDGVTGLRLATLADMTIKASRGAELGEADVRRLRLDDREERDFLEQVLGGAFEDMLTDGVRWPHIKRLGMYAFIYFGISEEAADAAAERGLFQGKAVAPTATNRTARRTGTRGTSSASGGSRKTTTRS